jgi:hypothetical protein
MKPQFSKKDIRRTIERAVEAMEQDLIDRLSIIGTKFVINARSTNTYKDRTGNLRHSIGYVVLRDGQPIDGNFHPGGEGSEKAKSITKELSTEFKTGFALIVVAGMDYAAYVEAKGFDVISGSSLQAEADLKRIFKKFRKT